MFMAENISKILVVIKKAVGCTELCSQCDKTECEYKVIAKALIEEGGVIPVLCKDCKQFDSDLGICKIRYDSWGSVLERVPHDWCSDGDTNNSNDKPIN